MIFYFSGTGNTRWAAEFIARHTGERILSISDEIKTECRYTLSDDERIGICFPIHGWQPPRIVRDFIKKLSLPHSQSHYCYALCTCGDTVGDAITILNKDLSKKGLEAKSFFSLVMPESYVCLPFMYTDTKKREREKIEAAKEKLSIIVDVIRNRENGVDLLKKGPAPQIYSYMIGNFFNKYMITDKPFKVDEKTCIKCGKCTQICPTDNIIGGHGLLPEWKHEDSCTCCLACYHHCPVHAINYGNITKKRGQYFFKE